MGDKNRDLIDASSFGEEGAQALGKTVPAEVVDAIVEAVKQKMTEEKSE